MYPEGACAEVLHKMVWRRASQNSFEISVYLSCSLLLLSVLPSFIYFSCLLSVCSSFQTEWTLTLPVGFEKNAASQVPSI